MRGDASLFMALPSTSFIFIELEVSHANKAQPYSELNSHRMIFLRQAKG